jgi:hypothetical protein
VPKKEEGYAIYWRRRRVVVGTLDLLGAGVVVDYSFL